MWYNVNYSDLLYKLFLFQKLFGKPMLILRPSGISFAEVILYLLTQMLYLTPYLPMGAVVAMATLVIVGKDFYNPTRT